MGKVLSTIEEIASVCSINEKKAQQLLSEGVIPSIFTGNGVRKRYYSSDYFIDYAKTVIQLSSNGALSENASNKEVFLSARTFPGIHEGVKKKAEVITFSNLKGGVGKTTNTINIAVSLAKLGQRVLVVDMDAQAQSSRYFRKVSYKGKSILSLFEKMMTREDDAITREEVLSKIVLMDDTGVEDTTLSILPSEISLTKKLEMAKVTMIRPEKMLDNLLEYIKDDFDFILIDTPPYPGLSLQLSFYASDKIVLVTEAEEFSIEGLESTIEEITDIQKHTSTHIDIDTVFVSAYKTLNYQSENLDAIIDIVYDKLGEKAEFHIVKSSPTIFGTAQSKQLPVIGYKKRPRDIVSIAKPFFIYAQSLILARKFGGIK